MSQPNGYVLWHGPSPLDGAPLVLIATGFAKSTANDKTGNMIQTWILRTDIDPYTAFRTEAGYSNCGNCTHRVNNTCYVNWWQAPLSIWHAYKRGTYETIPSWELFTDRKLRIGSAGDPAMVPVHIWHAALEHSSKHTGYTHQWREDFAQPLRGLVQASCDGFQDYLDATAHGWQPFLVKPADAPTPAGAIHCPSSKEMGRKTDCATCALCDGGTAPVVINAHGKSYRRVQLVN